MSLETVVNQEWVRLYGGEPVSDSAALESRVRNIAADRDAWVFNAKAIYLDAVRRTWPKALEAAAAQVLPDGDNVSARERILALRTAGPESHPHVQ